MANQLKSIYQNQPFKQTLVSSTTYSAVVPCGDFEGPFGVQLDWDSGASVNMNISIEISNNKQKWVTYPGSSTNILTNDDVHFWDMIETGAEFLRVKVEVITGSAIFTCSINGKGRV